MGITIAVVLVVVAVMASPVLVAWGASAGRMYTVDTAPRRDVALVFGASVRPDGRPSAYLAARLDLALELYQRGTVRAILVSGDNGEEHYNEPEAMSAYLIARGVPASQVVADYAGFDTYASCVRARKVFGATEVIAVSQTYHLPRAIATCRGVGVDAIGVGDDSVAGRWPQTWAAGRAREIPALYKMAYDLISHRTPVLGDRETSLDVALGR